MNLLSYRAINFYCFAIILSLLAFAGYLQYIRHLEPCPLCIIQRILFFFMAVGYFFGSFYQPAPLQRRIFQFIILMMAVLGAITAGRQVWLQHHPELTSAECIPNLHFLLMNMPWHKAIQIIFRGHDDCSTIHWQFGALSMPEWTLIFFCFFGLVSFLQMARK